MIKVGEKYKYISIFGSFNYSVQCVEPKKILEMVSEKNLMMVTTISDRVRYNSKIPLNRFERMVKNEQMIKI